MPKNIKKQKRSKADWNDFEKREATIKTRSKLLSHLSVSVLTVFLALGLFQAEFDGFKGLLIDGLFRILPSSGANPNIKLVGYDNESAAPYQVTHKIPADELIQTIKIIAEDKPLAIALIAPVNEKLYSEKELGDLAKAFEKTNMFIGYTDSQSLGKNLPTPLFHSAYYLPGYISRDTFSYGADSVSRRVMLTIDGIPTLYSKLGQMYESQVGSNTSYPKSRIERFGESNQTYINWQGPKGTYKILSTSQIKNNRFSRGEFANKIVLIGSTLTANKDNDFIFTPFSRKTFDTPLLEGAAHSLSTVLNKNGIIKSSQWINFLLMLFTGLILVNLIIYLSPAKSIQLLLMVAACLGVLAAVSLFVFDYWIDVAHSLILLAINYYLIIPYRLVDEYKKRWHYQEKSEFMAELEQLKSNFLSLISHDLKTPLARIQGNAELALTSTPKDAGDKQKKSLQAIVQTTEELSNYVETILDLTRIESSKVHLNKTSKDINSVIQEVVRSKTPLALDKNIKIEANLEPLFSFRFDVKLIQQVIANLVENAIKYSPENSCIRLESREVNSSIQVSIKDEGNGIALDEQEKIFSKFYRINNEASQKEKGTGLGLYLVKYFVELHEGFVTLNSELGKGSNFTVTLPV